MRRKPPSVPPKGGRHADEAFPVPSPSGRVREGLLSLFHTFSTSTMASSTSDPMAMAIPPRLMVLMVSPMKCSARTEKRSANGRVTREMTVVRALARKRARMMVTKRAPSSNESFTLPILLSMKRDWRKMSVFTFTSGGKVAFISSSERSIRSVSSRVPVCGCFVTVISTAGFPSTEAHPILGSCAPMRTSAMSFRVTGTVPIRFTTACPISSTRVVDTMPRTMYSLLCS